MSLAFGGGVKDSAHHLLLGRYLKGNRVGLLGDLIKADVVSTIKSIQCFEGARPEAHLHSGNRLANSSQVIVKGFIPSYGQDALLSGQREHQIAVRTYFLGTRTDKEKRSVRGPRI